MTISLETRRADYTATAAQTTFAYWWRIWATTDLDVYVNDVLQAPSTYTVTGIAPTTGGNVVFDTTLSAGDDVTILSSTPYVQLEEFTLGGLLHPKTFEMMGDKLTAGQQQLLERLERAVTLAVTSQYRNLTFPDPVPSRLIGYNAAGSALTTYPVTTGIGSSLILDHLGNYDNSLAIAVASVAASPEQLSIMLPTSVDAHLTVPGNVQLLGYPGGIITISGGATLTIQGEIRAGNYPLFNVVSGAVVISPQTPINPVWFTNGGLGTIASPWTSADGTAGFGGALAALQQYGMVKAPSGEYSWGAGTAGVNSDNITIELDANAHLVPTQNVVMFDLNTGAIANSSASNSFSHTIHFRGGYIDSGSEVSALIATGIQAYRVRNITIQDVRFRRLVADIKIAPMDTMIIERCFFRSSTRGIHLPYWMTTSGATPQDLWIQHCGWSSDNTTPMTCIDIESHVSSITVKDNGAAFTLGTFFQAVTGTVEGESANIRLHRNATEQATSQTLVRIYDTGGSFECTNLSVCDNTFGSSQAKVLDLHRMAGRIRIIGNHFENNAQFAIDLDVLRPDAVVRVADNVFEQLTANGGTLYEFTNVQQTARVIIGYNEIQRWNPDTVAVDYTRPGVRTFPASNTRFTDLGRAVSTLPSAAVLYVPPDANFAVVTGSTTIGNITATWAGHEFTLQFGQACTVIDGAGGNLVLAGDFVASADDTLTLICDGVNMNEKGRSVN